MLERIRRRAIKENRFDDADEKVMRRRLDIYEKETMPVLNFYPLTWYPVADRYLYTPLVGMIAPLILASAELAGGNCIHGPVHHDDFLLCQCKLQPCLQFCQHNLRSKDRQ